MAPRRLAAVGQMAALAAAMLSGAPMATGDVSVEYPASTGRQPDRASSAAARFGPDIAADGLPGTLVVLDDGCDRFNGTVSPNSTAQIALIARYNCHFVEKVKNAQDAGYSGVIVYDTRDGPLIWMSAMDSSSSEVKIPSVFVDREGGDLLKAAPNNTIVILTPDAYPEWPQYFTKMAAAAACGVLVFAIFVVYRRQHMVRRRANPRMSPVQALTLPSRPTVAADLDETCCICLEEYENCQVVTELPCRHIFHKGCVEPWLMQHDRKCPICKQDPLSGSFVTAAASERTPLLSDSAPGVDAGSDSEPDDIQVVVQVHEQVDGRGSPLSLNDDDAESVA